MRQRRQKRQTVFGARIALTVIALVASVLVASPPAAGAEQDDGVGVAAIPAAGRFQNWMSGKCLDAKDGGRNRDVIQWTCHGQANQQWNVVPLSGGYVGLVNLASYQCLEGLGAAGGYDAIQSDCGWKDSHHWEPRPTQQPPGNSWYFINKVTWKCLDASNWGQDENVITYDCHGDRNQQWYAWGY